MALGCTFPTLRTAWLYETAKHELTHPPDLPLPSIYSPTHTRTHHAKVEPELAGLGALVAVQELQEAAPALGHQRNEGARALVADLLLIGFAQPLVQHLHHLQWGRRI